MKLVVEKEFTLEVGDEVIEGSFRDLTKKEEHKITHKYEKSKKKNEELRKVMKKLKRLESKIKVETDAQVLDALYNQADALETKVEKLTKELDADAITEAMFKDRLTLSVMGDAKDRIMQLGEEYGYYRVFQTIIKDIAEKSEKN